MLAGSGERRRVTGYRSRGTRVATVLLLVMGAAGCAGGGEGGDGSGQAAAPTTNAPHSPLNCAAVPSSCGYPDETNTGVPADVELTPSGSITADTDGQVIEGLDVVGEINVVADRVVIRNTRVTGGRGAGNADWVVVMRPGASDLVIEDSELTTPAGTEQDVACLLNIGDGQPTVRRVNIHGCTAGVSSGGGLVEDSYIHDMSQVAGTSHVVGVASNGGGGLTVRHNTIVNRFEQTATVAFYQDFALQSDNLVVDNLVGGGGYCFYGGSGRFGETRNIRFVDNRLMRSVHPNCGSFGVIASFDDGANGNDFSGNYWDDTGLEVVP